MKYLMLYLPALLWLSLCSPTQAKEVRLYTQRHYAADKEFFTQFTKDTGIEVKVIKAGANELLARLKAEKAAPQADLFITTDAAALDRADAAGLLDKLNIETIQSRIPEGLQGKNGTWVPITMRGRVIVYSKERAGKNLPKTYKDLAASQWKGRVLIRSSSSGYNQSLLASILAAEGRPAALAWAQGVKNNMARPPQGGDRDQVRGVAQGLGELAVTNTYYLGLLEKSDDPKDRAARAAVGVIFPNQDDRGAHVNVSAAGIVKGGKNRPHAVALLEFLTSKEIQASYQKITSEFAVAKGVEPEPLQKNWGSFKADYASLHKLAGHQEEAVKIFDLAGWK
jgi:iron(III) transport system substrate-binding protein